MENFAAGFVTGYVLAFVVFLAAIALGQAAKRGDRQVEAERQEVNRKFPISPTS